MEKVDTLKLENEHLRILVQQDPLTKLFNRGAMEEKIGYELKHNQPGIFLMIDMDNFKLINEEYGHLMGDRILQSLGQIMTYVFFKKDIIGRMGGDEFAVFMSGEYTTELAFSKANSLKRRMLQAGIDIGIKKPVGLTIGADFARESDTFQGLYQRADTAMREGKRTRQQTLYFYKSSMQINTMEAVTVKNENFCMQDMKYIIQELKETSAPNGAYCQDYHTFLSLYRIFGRLLGRFNMKCHLILISMTDQYGAFVNLDERNALLNSLHMSICSSLRSSDVYTQYSSCQFLVITPGAGQLEMEIITSRIQKSFTKNTKGRTDIILSYNFYPLQSSVPEKTHK